MCTWEQRTTAQVLECAHMDHPPQTRLEWMRIEFQDARRRRFVKASDRAPASQARADAQALAPAVVIDPAATKRRPEQPNTR